MISWYRSLPRLTRYWFTATVVVSFFVRRFQLPPIGWLHFNWCLVYHRWEWWRCLTSLVVFPIYQGSMLRFFTYCYFLVTYSGKLEKEQFRRSPAGYLYLLIIVAVLANVGGFLIKAAWLMEITVMSVLYIWCHLNKDMTLSFWFGISFKAKYLPWILTIFHTSTESFVGMLIGHIYYLLKFQYNLLKTPRILKRILPGIESWN